MKSFLISCFLFLSLGSSAQVWENMGNPSLQRQATTTGYLYRFNAGSKGFVYTYSSARIDSLIRFGLPAGLQGQILRNTTDNTTVYTAQEPLVYGQFVYDDAQLTRALAAGQSTQLQIFNSFKRFSNGGNPATPTSPANSNLVPGIPSQTNSWVYDTLNNRLKSTINSGSTIGFISRDKYDRYVHTATFSADVADNDRIGVVIAFMEDPLDLVPNQAYGLNPADFNWPIDVTSQYIPNQHTLTLFRNRDDLTHSYYIQYDNSKLTRRTIYEGSGLPGLYNTTASWLGVTVDVKVVRAADSITVYTSQYSDAPGGKGSLAFPVTINLNSDPDLIKFKGKQPYGYAANSQAGAYFSNIVFSGQSNSIYDLRNGKVYSYTNGAYVLDPIKNMYTLLGNRVWWRNTTEKSFGYIITTNTYDVIVEAH